MRAEAAAKIHAHIVENTDRNGSVFLHFKDYGESHANTAVNAIKFYFEKVLLQPKVVYDLPRPRKPLVLPKVMGKKSVTGIIKAKANE